MNLYELVVSLLGEPPNQNIEYLYYILCCFIIVFTYKLILTLIRKVFNISKF